MNFVDANVTLSKRDCHDHAPEEGTVGLSVSGAYVSN